MRIGIVGGGQLGRMLTQAAIPLGFDVSVLDPGEGCPAAQVGAEQLVGDLSDPDALRRLADAVDVLTWEVEHIGAGALVELEREGHMIHPSPGSLLRIQDKFQQKRDLRDAGLPVGDFCTLDELEGSTTIDESTRFVVKSRRGGFDGRGNSGPLGRREITGAFDEPDLVYAERLLPFDLEIAVLVVRDRDGEMVSYDPVQTFQRDSICESVETSVALEPDRVESARTLGLQVGALYEGAGVFAVEMFVVGGELLVNEVAPRVHNSGHLTIEGSVTSQFENHVRAVAGLPLGSTAMRGPAVMVNLLGPAEAPLRPDGVARALAEPDTHVHLYGKSWRPGRKLGHITALGATIEGARDAAARARGAFQP